MSIPARLFSAGEPRQRLLFVDDEMKICRGVERLFRQYRVPWAYTFAGGMEEALGLLGEGQYDALVVDIAMPGRDGLELLALLRACSARADLPIVMVSDKNSRGLRRRALDLGATDLLDKPIDPDDLIARVGSILQLKRCQDIAKGGQGSPGNSGRLPGSGVAAETLRILWRMAAALEHKRGATANRLVRIEHYATLLAERLGLAAEFVATVSLAAPLHDLGLVAIPDLILMKPGPLSADERRMLQGHCAFGCRLFGRILREDGREGDASGPGRVLPMAAAIAGSHHERWNGNGYPMGLRGPEIPLAARLVAVADVYEALRENRPHKSKLGHEEAVTLMVENATNDFDPEVFAAFLACQGDFQHIDELSHSSPLAGGVSQG